MAFLYFSMRGNDLHLSSRNNRQNYYIKMTKTRTVTFLIMIISSCGLIVSLTDAYPAAEVTPELNLTDTQSNSNSSMQLAITHVVKTIEFEVGIIEDDGSGFDNSTDITTPEYIETNIKLLNVNLLREVLERADEDEDNVESTSTKSKEQDSSLQKDP